MVNDDPWEECRAGRPFRHLLEEHHQKELLYYKECGYEEVKILSAGEDNACKGCQKQHGKKFAIEEALKIMPIPNKTCKMDLYGNGNIGFCRCTYLPIIFKE